MRSATFIRRRTVHVPGAQPYGHFADHRAACPEGPAVTTRSSLAWSAFNVRSAHGRRTKVCHDPWVSTVSQNCPEACKAAQEHDEHEVATWSCVLRPCSRTLAKVSYNPRVSQFPGTAWPHTFQHQAL